MRWHRRRSMASSPKPPALISTGRGSAADQGSADDAGFGFVEQVDAGGAKGLEHGGGRFSPGDDECVDRVVFGQRLDDCCLRAGE